ncbi:MAG: VWA domain-containing protein, partial [Helicobacteraceae bacterium]|nr:VWA domain-containing protein [Helicobacteraceae bacterium]
MIFLYPWLFFLLIPLYILYRSEHTSYESGRQRQRQLLYLTIAFILMALTRPVITNTIENQKFDSHDFIIAIDASYSMQADDLKPTRYEIAKQNIGELLKELPKDRFSIFAFTSNAMLISPPTTDTEISMMALDILNPEYILTKGTSLYALLNTVSKTSYEKKYLIIFSDGGEEHNLQRVVSLAKKSTIIPYIIATGSHNGAVLKMNEKNIKDENNNLVISRINPILKDFALQSGGKYYELDSQTRSIVADIVSDLKTDVKETERTDIEVLSFTELFWIPLLLAILLFFTAVTKIHQLYLLLFAITALPESSHAYILDFYHVNKANNHYYKKEYLDSAIEFEKVTPSVESYYNIGVAYYKSGQYKKAIQTFSKIKTRDKNIKQKLFYNMG